MFRKEEITEYLVFLWFKWTPCFMRKLMVQIVEKAWEAGIVICVAAGE